MMANFLYLVRPCLLLALVFQVSMGTPVRTQRSLDTKTCKECANLSRQLIKNLRMLLENDGLFEGIDCREQRVEVNAKTQTVVACEPKTDNNSGCSNQRTTNFSQNECMRNITADLGHYVTSLKSYTQAQANLSSTIDLAQELLNNCPTPQGEPLTKQVPDPELTSGKSFDQRLHLCKVLKGFHVRVITISRSMGYIFARDQAK